MPHGFFLILFFLSLFILRREREHAQAGRDREIEKERERIPRIPVCTNSAETDVGFELTNHEIVM